VGTVLTTELIPLSCRTNVNFENLFNLRYLLVEHTANITVGV